MGRELATPIDTVSGSITLLEKRLTQMEALGKATKLSMADELVLKQLQQSLENLDSSFRSFHFEILDLIEERNQENKQTSLDERDNKISNIATRVRHLLAKISKHYVHPSNPDLELKWQLHRRFDQVEIKLHVHAVINATAPIDPVWIHVGVCFSNTRTR